MRDADVSSVSLSGACGSSVSRGRATDTISLVGGGAFFIVTVVQGPVMSLFGQDELSS